VHGANRLGTNSLLDLLVFGKHAGLTAAQYASGASFQPLPGDAGDFARAQFDALLNSNGTEKAADLATEMKTTMDDHVSVFRTQEGMQSALAKIRELKERFKQVHITDRGKVFNTDLMTTWELGNLVALAEVTTVCALARTESRGAHARDDYPKRDDANWMKHSLTWARPDGFQLSYKPVVITKFQPKERVY
jgi:succinate dehydrogenase / fumarate reductase flavoprotein subunit